MQTVIEEKTEKKEQDSDPNRWDNIIDHYARKNKIDISELDTASIIQKAKVLESEISQLQRAIIDKRDRIEHNLGPNAKKTKEEIYHLRELYDKHIGNGEAVKADEILGEIKTKRQNMRKQAQNILSASDDFSSLEDKQKELYQKALALIEITKTNWIVAQILENTGRAILSNASDSVNHYLNKLRDESEKAKKIANRILSE